MTQMSAPATAIDCEKVYTLNTGATIPALGLGTWRSTEEECYNSVKSALENGYTHIDTARVYGNEDIVGRAINDYLKESGTAREKLFITTKLWSSECMNPEKALKESIERLGMDYVDLFLIHWPVGSPNDTGVLIPEDAEGNRIALPFDEWNYIDTYKLMQHLPSTGLTKAIGVSNLNKPKLENLINHPEINVIPATNQVEMHPLLPQLELVDFCKKNNILVQCYSPLGSVGAPVLQDEFLNKMADAYQVSPATLAISWAINRDVVVLPKSVKPERVISNRKTIVVDPAHVAEIENYGESKKTRVVNPNWTTSVNIFEDSPKY